MQSFVAVLPSHAPPLLHSQSAISAFEALLTQVGFRLYLISLPLVKLRRHMEDNGYLESVLVFSL